MKRAFERKVTSWFGFAAILAISLAAGCYLTLKKSTENVSWVEHTHEVLHKLQRLASLLDETTFGVRGYVIMGDDRFLEPYRRASPAIDGELKAIRQLTADNSVQQQRLTALEALLRRGWTESTRISTSLVAGELMPTSACMKTKAAIRSGTGFVKRSPRWRPLSNGC